MPTFAAATGAQERDAARRSYVQSVASSDRQGTADDISRLADLQDKGVINEAEFQQAKARVLSLLCPL
jgi:hypothetical protein